MLSIKHRSWICLPLSARSSRQRLKAARRLSELCPYTGCYLMFFQSPLSAENGGISNKATGSMFLKGPEAGVTCTASPNWYPL